VRSKVASSERDYIHKPTAWGYAYLALFLGVIIGMMVAKTTLEEDIATSYMVSHCQKSEDINAKYFRCEY